jgi:hypothetical protein
MLLGPTVSRRPAADFAHRSGTARGKSHGAETLEKLQLRDRIQAVVFALRMVL